MQIVNIDGKDGLVRDTSTRAIININKIEYENHLVKREQSRIKQDQIDQHSKEINSIKEDITELKQILLSLVDKFQR
jgi:hypothetical protein